MNTLVASALSIPAEINNVRVSQRNSPKLCHRFDGFHRVPTEAKHWGNHRISRIASSRCANASKAWLSIVAAPARRTYSRRQYAPMPNKWRYIWGGDVICIVQWNFEISAN